MDPAIKAAEALSKYFQGMEVPCTVKVDDKVGKHVAATADVEAGASLVEEVPVVSWPSPALLMLSPAPFCFHCLQRKKNTNPDEWLFCDGCGSHFCSSVCRAACEGVHGMLCPTLKTLRRGSKEPQQQVITPEAVARCVALIITRVASTVERQGLSDHDLQEDFKAHGTSSVSLVSQLFEAASLPFNRLIGAPDGTEFTSVDMPRWIEVVRDATADAARDALRRAAAGSELSVPSAWADAVVAAATSNDTIATLIGQLALNAHAVNDYVLLPSASSAEGQTLGAADSQEAAGGVAFDWIMKGGAVYTLLSAFNHSCDPNTVVSNVDGTHEIVLKTSRAVRAGEELSITYIPLKAGDDVKSRREQLKGYFFTCNCPRCEAECATGPR